jgi:PAS domain S-box-containing protein
MGAMPESRGLSEAQLRSLGPAFLEAANAAGLGITLTSATGPMRRLYVNETAARIFGYTVDELLGASILQTFPPEAHARIREMQARRVRGEALPPFIEVEILRKDGTRRPVEAGFSMVSLDGEPVAAAFLRDITERKQAEAALVASDARQRRILEASPDGIVVVREGRFVDSNRRAVDMLGYDRVEDLVGRPISDFVDATEQSAAHDRSRRVERGERLAPREYRAIRRDGARFPVEVTSIPIEVEGRPSVLSFVRDLSERVRFQTQLMQADRLATIGTMAAGLAHEINNPLAYVMMNLEILGRILPETAGDGESREAAAAAVRTVRAGTERVATIVRDLLGLARASSEGRRVVDVRKTIDSALAIATVHLGDRARVVRDFQDVPSILADPARLGQVFLNLFVNAGQAFAERPDRVGEVRIVVRADPPEHVVVDVTDDGPGIPPDVLPRVFEPFFTTKPPGVGTGLGLPICESIVASLGGELTVDSEVGRGTTVRVRLPAGRPGPAA